jgi:hypothetical protein
MTDQPVFDLVPLATVRVTRGDVYRLGQTAFNKRVIGSIANGRWEGERFSGEIIAPGGDWALIAVKPVRLVKADLGPKEPMNLDTMCELPIRPRMAHQRTDR